MPILLTSCSYVFLIVPKPIVKANPHAGRVLEVPHSRAGVRIGPNWPDPGDQISSTISVITAYIC